MLTARLVIEAIDAAELEPLLAGRADVQLVAVDAGIAGELLRHDLRPLRAESLSAFALAEHDRERCSGPLLRVFTYRPVEDT